MRSRLRPWWPAGAVAVLIVAALAVPDGQDGSPSGPRTVRVLQYNLCGAAAACPWNAGGSGPGTSVARLVREAVRLRPDLITVNEICLTQYSALKDRLARAGLPMDGTYASALDNVPACGTSGRFGSAVLSRGDVPDDRQDYRRFTHTGAETYTGQGRTAPVHRGLLCARTRLDAVRLVACTAHTYAKAPEQLREIRDRMAEFPADLPLVLAGDLNLPPRAPALALLTDRFVEADAAQRATAGGRKIDYVFATRRHFSARDADVRAFPESDHALLQGLFARRPGT